MTDLPLLDERTRVACKLPPFWPLNKRGVVFLRFPTPNATVAERMFGEALAWGLTRNGGNSVRRRVDN